MKRLHITISDKAYRKLRTTVVLTGLKPSKLFEEMIEIEAKACEKLFKVRMDHDEKLKAAEQEAVCEFVEDRVERHRPEEEKEDDLEDDLD